MDCVLIEIFKILKQKAKPEIAHTKANVDVAKPMDAKLIEKKKNAKINGIRLSNFDTNQPEIGKPINELTGMAIKIVPNCASFKSKNALMVGIRDAQVAKQIPDKKK
ncbi:hypothetical protein GCM10023163_21600 [Aestuariibaculum suncheonense]